MRLIGDLARMFLRRTAQRVHTQAAGRLGVLQLLSLGGRLFMVLAVAGHVAAGLMSLGFVVASSVMLGRLPEGIAEGWSSAAGRSLMVALVTAGALFAGMQLLPPLVSALSQLMSRRIDSVIRDRVAGASSTAPLAALEDQGLLDLVTDATRGLEYGHTPGKAALAQVSLIGRYLPVLGATVIVGVVFSPWAAVGLLFAGLVLRHGARGGATRESGVWRAGMPDRREGRYFYNLGLDVATSNEIRVFGLLQWVRDRHHAAVERAWRTVWRAQLRLYRWNMIGYGVIAVALTALVLVGLAGEAASGGIALRDVSLVVQGAFLIVSIGAIHGQDFVAAYGIRAYNSIRAFERRAPAAAAQRTGTRDSEGLPRVSLSFEDVSFVYPGTGRPVFTGLNVEIGAGQSTAIVGLNGAGKTTLVKLLAGLYEPTSGRICVDGIDIRELRSWQSRVAAIFQDFARYELSAADNIGFGSLALREDRDAIARAARGADAFEFIEQLPQGFDTPLARRLAGGAQVSGGQWQRIALARALLAIEGGASVLALDEPTANLDVHAEVEFFDRIVDLLDGVTTILISHRFSTVRRAERIVLLEDGQIVEDGSHSELMALGARYSELFMLQASRFELVAPASEDGGAQ